MSGHYGDTPSRQARVSSCSSDGFPDASPETSQPTGPRSFSPIPDGGDSSSAHSSVYAYPDGLPETSQPTGTQSNPLSDVGDSSSELRSYIDAQWAAYYAAQPDQAAQAVADTIAAWGGYEAYVQIYEHYFQQMQQQQSQAVAQTSAPEVASDSVPPSPPPDSAPGATSFYTVTAVGLVAGATVADIERFVAENYGKMLSCKIVGLNPVKAELVFGTKEPAEKLVMKYGKTLGMSMKETTSMPPPSMPPLSLGSTYRIVPSMLKTAQTQPPVSTNGNDSHLSNHRHTKSGYSELADKFKDLKIRPKIVQEEKAEDGSVRATSSVSPHPHLGPDMPPASNDEIEARFNKLLEKYPGPSSVTGQSFNVSEPKKEQESLSPEGSDNKAEDESDQEPISQEAASRIHYPNYLLASMRGPKE